MKLIGGKFRLISLIGKGGFGFIYLGINEETSTQVAVKIELVSAKSPQLPIESKMYRILEGGTGTPKLQWSGSIGKYNILVLPLLGPSLEDLLRVCGHKFSLKTVLLLADQLINRLEFIHSRGFIHRDVKPENFLMGMGRKLSIVHVIDLGLCKKYRNPWTLEHIPYCEGKRMTGTVRYATIHTHLGRQQSRRDDMESLAYVLFYLLKGHLPWQKIVADNKADKRRLIGEKKMSMHPLKLCGNLPTEFAAFLDICRKMEFTETPDYTGIRSMFLDLFHRCGYQYDYEFDWNLIKFGDIH